MTKVYVPEVARRAQRNVVHLRKRKRVTAVELGGVLLRASMLVSAKIVVAYANLARRDAIRLQKCKRAEMMGNGWLPPDVLRASFVVGVIRILVVRVIATNNVFLLRIMGADIFVWLELVPV